MKTILITGGAGFIGSALVRMLIRETEHTVHNVDSLTYAGNLESLPGLENEARHTFHRVDICDAAEIQHLLASSRQTDVTLRQQPWDLDGSISSSKTTLSSPLLGCRRPQSR